MCFIVRCGSAAVDTTDIEMQLLQSHPSTICFYNWRCTAIIAQKRRRSTTTTATIKCARSIEMQQQQPVSAVCNLCAACEKRTDKRLSVDNEELQITCKRRRKKVREKLW